MTVCGVKEQAWPYACSVNDNNGINFDPVSGKLWVAPVYTDYGVMVERFNNDFGMLIPSNNFAPINWYSTVANGSMVRRDVGSATQNWFCSTPATYGTRLTCPDDPCFGGWYECTLNVMWLTTNPIGMRAIGIRLNGTGNAGSLGSSTTNGIFFSGIQQLASNSGFWAEQVYVREIYLRPGDYIQAMAFHNVPSWNLAVCGSMSVRWVGSQDPNTVGGGAFQNQNTPYPAPLPRSGSCP